MWLVGVSSGCGWWMWLAGHSLGPQGLSTVDEDEHTMSGYDPQDYQPYDPWLVGGEEGGGGGGRRGRRREEGEGEEGGRWGEV